MMKRRAPRACLQCRQRKIKCDVSNIGPPCGNCIRLEKPCSVNHARKSRKASSRDEHGLPFASIHTFEVQPLQTISHDEGPDGSTHLQHVMIGATNELSSESINLPTMSSSTISSQPPSSTPSAILSVPDTQLPSYITPFRETLDPGILSFLHWRGALSVPQGAFRESLLRAYICYVHPYLPLLDLEEFLSAIEDDGKSRTVSLTLFQAVMFAGSTFVDMDVLEREGFKSHEQARRKFYCKVRVSC
jgi:hypothetical protein